MIFEDEINLNALIGSKKNRAVSFCATSTKYRMLGMLETKFGYKYNTQNSYFNKSSK